VVENLANLPILLPTEEVEVCNRPLGDGIEVPIEGTDVRPSDGHPAAINRRVPLLDEREPRRFRREPTKLVVHDGGGRPRGRHEVGQGLVNLLLGTEHITRAALPAIDRHGGRRVGLTGRRHRVP